MKIVFFGSSEFAVPALKNINKHFDIACIATQPDKPKGRGLHKAQTPIKIVARELGYPVIQPINLKNHDFLNHIKSLKVDIGIVISYGKILPQELLDIPKFGFINIHAGLLPKYRGASPVNTSIKNGDITTGTTIIKVSHELDAGDIIMQAEIPIEHNDNADSIFDKLSDLGGELIIRALKEYEEKGFCASYVQDHSKCSYAHKIKKEDCLINWNDSSKNIFNFIRSLSSLPCAHTHYKEKNLKIYKSEIIDFQTDSKIPGEIAGIIKKQGIVVKTNDGCLLIQDLQIENSKRMPAQSFLCGFKDNLIGEILK